MDDEPPRAAIHDVVGAGGDVGRLITSAGWDPAQAQRLLTQVLADYVTELNRALATGTATPFGITVSAFMQQYDTL